MILMIDNFDSFTYNLVQYLEMLRREVRVLRNNESDCREIADMEPEAIIISPGPGGPEEAGVSVDVIKQFSGRLPILGVCLGHQCIGAAFGGEITGAASLMHGKTSKVEHWGDPLFSGIKSPFTAIRYHSLVIASATLPQCLEVTAKSEDNEIMAVRHRQHPTVGIQFHPESILTPSGKRILKNFLEQELS